MKRILFYSVNTDDYDDPAFFNQNARLIQRRLNGHCHCEFLLFNDTGDPSAEPLVRTIRTANAHEIIRLTCKVYKYGIMDIMPDYDYYFWMDASVTISDADAVAKHIARVISADIVFACTTFGERNTYDELALIRELGFMKEGKVDMMLNDCTDARLPHSQKVVCTTVLIFKNDHELNSIFHALLSYMTERLVLRCQPSLTYVLWKSGCISNPTKYRYSCLWDIRFYKTNKHNKRNHYKTIKGCQD